MATGNPPASSGSTDLNWLPSDAEEQLSLGFRIISNAYKTRVQTLEGESRGLKHQLEEKVNALTALQKRHSTLEVEMIEVHQRASQLGEENRKLIRTVEKLHRDIQRLESLKRAVLNSIQGEERDDEPKLYLTGDYLQTTAPLTMQDISGELSADPYSRFAKSQDLIPPTPDKLGMSTRSINSEFAKSQDLIPPTPDKLGMSTPSIGMSTPCINSDGAKDGKAFFRNARTRLSPEDFNRFLGYIKKLNNPATNKDLVLAQVQDTFGETNADLFEDFTQLLANRN